MNVAPLEDDGLSMPVGTHASQEELQKAVSTTESTRDQDLQLGKSTPGPTKKSHPKEVAQKMGEKKKRRKKKWKRPKDKPTRPLSAYNLFFQHERAILLGKDAPTDADEELKKKIHCKTHGKIGFAEMARTIGSKWKAMKPEEKIEYETEASKEKKRYAEELAAWKEEQKTKSQSQLGDDSENSGLGLAASASAASVASKPAVAEEELTRNDPSSTSARAMLSDHSLRQNTMAHLQAMPAQTNISSSLEYLRALREQQQMDAALFGRSQFDAPLMQYPSAAEASANILMQHFQGQTSSVPQLPQPSIDTFRNLHGGVQEQTRALSSMDAFMLRLQNEQDELSRKKEEVEALMQQLQGGANAEAASRSQGVPQGASMDTLLHQYQGGLPSQDLLQHTMPRRQLDLGLQNMGMYSPNISASAMRQLQQRYSRGRGNDFTFQGHGGGDFPRSGR